MIVLDSEDMTKQSAKRNKATLESDGEKIGT